MTLEQELTEPAGNIRTTSSREQSASPSTLRTTRVNSLRDSLLIMRESNKRRPLPKERRLSKNSNKLLNNKMEREPKMMLMPA
jgi:hypothetical protein